MPPFSWASHSSPYESNDRHAQNDRTKRDFDDWRRNEYKDARRIDARLIDLWVKAMVEVKFSGYNSYDAGKLDEVKLGDMADMIRECKSSVSVHSGGITLLYSESDTGVDYDMWQRLSELGAFREKKTKGSDGVSKTSGGSGGGTGMGGSSKGGKTRSKKHVVRG